MEGDITAPRPGEPSLVISNILIWQSIGLLGFMPYCYLPLSCAAGLG